MPYPKLFDLIRHFPENGMKLMLEDPQNVCDLLSVLGTDLVRVIDFARMKLVQTTFVERDYRHVESDVVLTAPLRIRGRSRRRLMIYILIEHQSEPDLLMPLRMLEYVVQIFKFQTRNWSARHRSFARLRLEPVLPFVFYTGVRRWDSIGTLTDLIELGERFVSVTPLLQPLFLNLATIVPGRLDAAARAAAHGAV
jgi:hypothetical protein